MSLEGRHCAKCTRVSDGGEAGREGLMIAFSRTARRDISIRDHAQGQGESRPVESRQGDQRYPQLRDDVVDYSALTPAARRFPGGFWLCHSCTSSDSCFQLFLVLSRSPITLSFHPSLDLPNGLVLSGLPLQTVWKCWPPPLSFYFNLWIFSRAFMPGSSIPYWALLNTTLVLICIFMVAFINWLCSWLA